MIKAILFDIDGTLIRTGGAGVRAFAQTFQSAFGLPQATARLNFAGRTDVSLLRECFQQHGIPFHRENLEEFFGSYVFWLQEFLETLDGSPCPGVEDFITQTQKLPRPPLLGLLTGNIRLGAELKLRRYGLWEHFECGAFADDHEDRNCIAGKALERAQKLHGAELNSSEVLVIGDTPLDISCARSISARVLGVCTGGFTYAQLSEHKPDFLAETLEHLSLSDLA